MAKTYIPEAWLSLWAVHLGTWDSSHENISYGNIIILMD